MRDEGIVPKDSSPAGTWCWASRCWGFRYCGLQSKNSWHLTWNFFCLFPRSFISQCAGQPQQFIQGSAPPVHCSRPPPASRHTSHFSATSHLPYVLYGCAIVLFFHSCPITITSWPLIPFTFFFVLSNLQRLRRSLIPLLLSVNIIQEIKVRWSYRKFPILQGSCVAHNTFIPFAKRNENIKTLEHFPALLCCITLLWLCTVLSDSHPRWDIRYFLIKLVFYSDASSQKQNGLIKKSFILVVVVVIVDYEWWCRGIMLREVCLYLKYVPQCCDLYSSTPSSPCSPHSVYRTLPEVQSPGSG